MELGSYNQSLETSREGPRDDGVENRDWTIPNAAPRDLECAD
jgi:hypothetical protein